jgi:MFS transporter, DHA2 family, multidrug resistance protein
MDGDMSKTFQHSPTAYDAAMGIAAFAVASFFCGSAVNIQQLVLFRFSQGLAAGAIFISSHTMITESWPVGRRATSQALFILCLTVGGAMTAPVGGFITDDFGWRYMFFAEIPAGIILLLLVLICIRNKSSKKEAADILETQIGEIGRTDIIEKPAEARHEDWAGMTLLSIGGSFLYCALSFGFPGHWFTSRYIMPPMLIGATAMGLFIWRQFFTQPSKSDNLQTGLIMSFILCFITLAARCMIAGFGILNAQIDAWFWIYIFTYIFTGAITVALLQTTNVMKYLIAGGLLCFAVYVYATCSMPSADPKGLMLICGVIVCVFSITVSTLTLSGLQGRQLGLGIAAYNVIQQIGGSLGIAVSRHATRDNYDAFHLFMWVVVAICLASAPFVMYAVKGVKELINE